jgi:hypothetical protein
MNKNRAIVILSCDKYNDVWPYSIASIDEYIKRENYKIYYVTNELEINHPDISNIKTGRDKNWSDSFINALEQIKEQQLFIWLEDMLFISKIDEKLFQKGFECIESRKFAHVHFRPLPKPDLIKSCNEIGLYEKGRPYSTNLVGYWNKKILQKMLINGENPWNFEVFGSYRIQYYGLAGCLMNEPFDYLHLIEKGRWIPGVKKFLLNKYPEIPMAGRKDTRAVNKLLSIAKSTIFNFMMHLPWRMKMSFINIIRKLLGIY